MLKEEFERLIGIEIPQGEFDAINMVWQYHPSIPETDPEEHFAELYEWFGMTAIYDMLPRAERVHAIVKKIDQLKIEIEACKNAIEELGSGKLPVPVTITTY